MLLHFITVMLCYVAYTADKSSIDLMETRLISFCLFKMKAADLLDNKIVQIGPTELRG